MNGEPSTSRSIAAIALYIIALCQITQCVEAREQSQALQKIAQQVQP